MTNEELKKKIVDIALHAEWMDMFGDHNSIGKYAANAIADALIAAGIGDVKDLQAQVNVLEITNIALQAGYDDAEKDRLYWVNKYKEAEHRADVAERALHNACEDIEQLTDCCRWAAFGGVITIKEYTPENATPQAYIDRAKKELAEERKDEN